MLLREDIHLEGTQNPWGPSRAAQACLAEVNEESVSESALLSELASRRGVAADQVILGRGSLGVLRKAARAVLAAGGSAVMPKHSFALAGAVLREEGARLIESPAITTFADASGLLRSVQLDTRLVYLAHVSNPTSVKVDREFIRSLVLGLREDILLVIDEAYAEYEEPLDFPGAADLLPERERMLVLRTFSKLHALADLRIGYGLGNPYLLSSLGTDSAWAPGHLGTALAAIKDEAFETSSRRRNREAREAFLKEAERHRCHASSEGGNFALLETMFPGSELAKDLLKRGVRVRSLDADGFPNHVRIALGEPRFMDAFWEIAAPVLDGTGCFF